MFLRKKGRRHKILKAVYEDNLRIIGKHYSLTPAWKIPFFLKGQFLFLYMLMLIILGHADYLDSTYSSEDQRVNALMAGKKLISKEYLSLIDAKGVPLKQVFGLGVKTIVIDPGHGGDDPGTVGKLGLKEKDISLDIAKRLRERLLRHKEYNVLLTREGDETVALTKRIEIASSVKADMFISIHVNYLPLRPINIIETYYFGVSEDNKILKLAVKENADSHYSLTEFKEVIEKIGDTLKLQESRKLASFIQSSLYLNIRGRGNNALNYGVKRAPFVVLLGIDMPGVLTEVSCLSNKEEELRLYKVSYRDDIARYIESGILNYLKKGEPLHEAKRRND